MNDGDSPAWPTDARVYNEAIGVRSGTEADREVLRAMDEVAQLSSWPGRENRSFMVRAVTYLARAGIDQFLDLGAGLPAWGNVHEVARRFRPDAAVAYVDHDPEVVDAWREIAAGAEPMRSVRCDVRRPREILDHPDVRAVIDFDRPVGLLMTAVLPLVPKELHAEIVRTLTDALPPGSYLVLSLFSDDDQPPELFEAVRAIVESFGAVFAYASRAEIAALFEGLDPVDPGLVMVECWHPVHDPIRTSGWFVGGVARKP